MIKLKTTNSNIESAPKSYVRVFITEDKTTRVRERDNGVTEMVFGVGKFKEITPQDFQLLIRKIVRTAQQNKYAKIALQFERSQLPQLSEYKASWFTSVIAENVLLANYEFTAYKTDIKNISQLNEVLICGGMSKDEKAGLERGKIVGHYTNLCRDIANTTGGDMTPSLLGKEAQKAVKGTSAKVKVLSNAEVKKHKMGALLGVAQGSKEGARLIVVEYDGAGKPSGKNPPKTKRPLVYVGKGVTYDTGGLSLKPSDYMLDMHLDMSGGAAVIAAIACAAKLKLKKNIIGIIPTAENSVSEDSIRPGDILTSMSGKTIDVLNTDAEGRLVLADGLTYAQRYNPRLVIDVATLTGAALAALGENASAIITEDKKLETTLHELGNESGDLNWPLPLWKVHKTYMKGRFGDVANMRTVGNARYGGTIEGAAFLSFFVEDFKKDCKWAHIDMAPRMTTIPGDNLAKGAAGEPVRLLVKLAETY